MANQNVKGQAVAISEPPNSLRRKIEQLRQFAIGGIKQTKDLTDAYTLIEGDAGVLLLFTSATDKNITVPASLPEGWWCACIQLGAGKATFVAASGATVNSLASAAATAGQYGSALIEVVANSDGASASAVVTTELENTPLVTRNGELAPHANLRVQNNTGSPNTHLDIDADELLVFNSGGGARKLSSVNLTADITASGANGLDTGSEAISTWYHAWVIYNSATDTVAALMSASASAPTLPSGYTYSAYIGAVYNDSSGNLIAIAQRNREVVCAEASVLTGGTASTITAVDLSAAVPPSAQRAAGRINAGGTSVTSRHWLLASTTAGLGSLSYLKNTPSLTGDERDTYSLPLVEPQVIAYQLLATGSGRDLDLFVSGWSY